MKNALLFQRIVLWMKTYNTGLYVDTFFIAFCLHIILQLSIAFELKLKFWYIVLGKHYITVKYFEFIFVKYLGEFFATWVPLVLWVRVYAQAAELRSKRMWDYVSYYFSVSFSFWQLMKVLLGCWGSWDKPLHHHDALCLIVQWVLELVSVLKV